jgi:methionyl-tRNA synthetase
MSERILVTSALPYANGLLHFGHIAGAYLPADVYCRFQRLLGSDVLYICGSDEYGVAITLSAELAGRTPQQQVDLFHHLNHALFQKLNISFDHYSRTTWPGHVPTVQQFFLDLLKDGYIEEKETDQLYSTEENRFLADRYVVGSCPKCIYPEARGDECQRCGASYEATQLGSPRSKLTGSSLVPKPTRHWFLRFDLFQDRLATWLRAKSWKPSVENFAMAYVSDLKPRAITRDSSWGIPVPLPEAKGKVFYVWFDAPIGYISATKDWAAAKGTPDAWKGYWLDPATQYVQFIGKDNIPFHAVFFPAMVMGQTIPYKLVDQLPANEFLNLEGRQFSKSDGWTIDLDRFFQHFTADQIRYTLAANAPETQDAEFTWEDFQIRCNSELLGKYGNLANRLLVFAATRCGGIVPHASIDAHVIHEVRRLIDAAKEAYSGFHVRRAASLVMELAQFGNVYFDGKKPWQLAKDPAKKPAMDEVIISCLYILRALALISAPIIPEAAEALLRLLGVTTPLSSLLWDDLSPELIQAGTPLPPPTVLFRRVEDSVIEEEENLLRRSLIP